MQPRRQLTPMGVGYDWVAPNRLWFRMGRGASGKPDCVRALQRASLGMRFQERTDSAR
jgi:hypothetical protein